MIVRVDRDGRPVEIVLEESRWGSFVRRYGEPLLHRLCELLLDPTLSLVEIINILGIPKNLTYVWSKKVTPYIPSEYRVTRSYADRWKRGPTLTYRSDCRTKNHSDRHHRFDARSV